MKVEIKSFNVITCLNNNYKAKKSVKDSNEVFTIELKEDTPFYCVDEDLILSVNSKEQSAFLPIGTILEIKNNSLTETHFYNIFITEYNNITNDFESWSLEIKTFFLKFINECYFVDLGTLQDYIQLM